MADKLLSKIKKSSFAIDTQKTYIAAASRININKDPLDELLNRNMLIGGIPPANINDLGDLFIVTENLNFLMTESNDNLIVS